MEVGRQVSETKSAIDFPGVCLHRILVGGTRDELSSPTHMLLKHEGGVITVYGTFTEYSSSGQPILVASPSAVNLSAGLSSLEQNADLLNNTGSYTTSPSYQYLYSNSGLVTITDFGASTTATATAAGDVTGYVKDTQIKQGESGTAIPQDAMQYYQRTGGGSTVFPVATDTTYGLTGSGDPRTTNYFYTWYTGTVQMQSETTTKPVVSTSQNGSGSVTGAATSGSTTTLVDTSRTEATNYFVGYFVQITSGTGSGQFARVVGYNGGTKTITVTGFTTAPDSTSHYTLTPDAATQYFDSYGRATWTMDGGGFLNYSAYDMGTGAVITQITDVNTAASGDFTGLPTGWVTPPGGGLELKTLTSVDLFGRPLSMTGPGGNVIDMVYNDTYATSPTAALQGIRNEVRTYSGWTGSAETGPTQISREYRPASGSGGFLYDESITTSDSPHVTSSLPDGSEAVTASGIQSLSRSITSSGGQVLWSDAFPSLSGVNFAEGMTADGSGNPIDLGTSGTNFYRTTNSYDSGGRLNRVLSPTGTINRTVYDGLSRVISQWVGTNDTPASGYWSPSNNTSPSNMVDVQDSYYDQFPQSTAAPSAPTLSQTAGGSIAATTYYVVVTYVTALGSTVESSRSSLAVSANNLLSVTSPSSATGATGYNVYVSTASGTELLQNASPIAIGTNWTEPTSGLLTNTAPAPTGVGDSTFTETIQHPRRELPATIASPRAPSTGATA